MKDVENKRVNTITNALALATTPARADLLHIAEAGYAAIRTGTVIRSAIALKGDSLSVGGRTYDLASYEHLYVLGVGKCSLDAARELEDVLGERITEGAVLDVRAGSLRRIVAYEGTHPYPSAQNAEHTRRLMELAKKAGERDLVLTVISGGGSALLCEPKTHTPLEEAALVRHLFKGGATIEELNVVRKHLSLARGGNMAVAAYPATVIALLFSDVPGDDVRVIASGPTVRDESTRTDAHTVLTKYRADRIGFSPEHLLDTPKEGKYFARVHNVLVLTNATALEAMRERAETLGYDALIRDVRMQGEAREVGVRIAKELHSAKRRTVLLFGGETTVTIRGTGAGGRNEELSLGALSVLQEDELVLSLASDGRDNTEYAGGIADRETVERAQAHNMLPDEYLKRNDSYTFFHTLRQGVETGYTGANIADLVIAIKHDRL